MNRILEQSCYILLTIILCSGFAVAQEFPGEKTLDENSPSTVGTGKAESTSFQFSINLDAGGFADGDVVTDVIPAEFDIGGICTAGNEGTCCTEDADCDIAGTCELVQIDQGFCNANLFCEIGGVVTSIECNSDADCVVEENQCTAGDPELIGMRCAEDADCSLAGTCGEFQTSCGVAESIHKNPNKDKNDKLRPDHINWDLSGCDPVLDVSLSVCIVTDENPGKGHAKRGLPAFFEPTSCGPLYLNDGAMLNDSELSNSLVVAACEDETAEDCMDEDLDGWSIDCGDCDDQNAEANPDGIEICDDQIDNDCDGLTDLEDPACG